MRREWGEVALIEYRLDELSLHFDQLASPNVREVRERKGGWRRGASKKKITHTYRFRSSFRASGLTPTRFRSMRDMTSSRKTTISWPKNFNRHGLLARWTLGILERRRAVNEARSGLRGRTELTVRSEGPGTKTKCVRRVMRV